MTEKTLNRITAISAFLFALCCILWVILSLSVLPNAAGQNDYSLLILDPDWSLVTLVGLLSSLFGIFSVMGIFHANRDTGGFLLFAGTVLLVLGMTFEFAALTWDLFIWPVVCASEPYISFVRDGILLRSPQFTAFFICMLGFLLAGNILISIALFKGRNYGRLIPILMLLGIILYGIGNLVYLYLASAGLFIYGLAFVLIGLRLRKE